MKSSGYEKRKSNYGRMFISVWVVGIILLFIVPLVRTVQYSFNTLDFSTLEMKAAGLSYYVRMFLKDTAFIKNLSSSMTDLLYQVPIVVLFSMFIAVLLNREFRGRLFFRAVFFLPVVVMSGVVFTILRGDTQSTEMMSEAGNVSNAFNNLGALQDLLATFGAGTAVIDFMSNVVDRTLDTVWLSGVQILLFLAGLQSVSPALYEAARIEGATKWEEFWKITFPMLIPVLFVCVIYSIIDSFTSQTNAVISYIQETSFSNFDYSYGCAMSVVYSLIILLVIGLMYLIIRPFIASE